MKRFALLVAVLASGLTGCARPGEFGDSPAYTRGELNQQIARSWDWEGKQIVDDVDHILLLRPMGHLTLWDLR